MGVVTIVPLVVTLPTTLIVASAAIIPLSIPDRFAEAELVEVSASLQVLTTGPFTVEVRRRNGVLLDTLTFNAAGVLTHDGLSFSFIQPGGGLRFDVAAPGVGALHCTVTCWLGLAL